jgi:hypothetical protein
MAEETHAGVEHLIGFVGLFAKVLRVLAQRPAQAFALPLAVLAPLDFTVGIDHDRGGRSSQCRGRATSR